MGDKKCYLFAIYVHKKIQSQNYFKTNKRISLLSTRTGKEISSVGICLTFFFYQNPAMGQTDILNKQIDIKNKHDEWRYLQITDIYIYLKLNIFYGSTFC